MTKHVEQYHGVLPVNKQSGLTSHDVVQKLRRVCNQRRIGHTGTLDPLAEGLMVVCLGRATRIVRFLTDWDKCYKAVLYLGLTSTTFDREGVDPEAVPKPVPSLSQKDIDDILERFRGRISQTVPVYSSIRVDGERLYNRARRGEDITPPSREVVIDELTMTVFEPPYMQLTIKCSKGTYIRSLADDIGKAVGCGAYLERLKRVSIGNLHLDDSYTLEQIEQKAESGDLDKIIRPCHEVLDYSAICVTGEFGRNIVNGPLLKKSDVVRIDGCFDPGDTVLIKDKQGNVLAVGTAGTRSSDFRSADDRKLFEYKRVLN